MEEFQRIEVIVDRYGRDIEVEGIVHQLLQGIGRDILAKERLRHTESDFGERQGVDGFVEVGWQDRNGGGHVQAAVGSQAFDNGFLQSGIGSLVIRAIVFHNVVCFKGNTKGVG